MVETPFLEASKLRGAPVWGGWTAGVGWREQFLILSDFCGSRSCGAPACTRCRLPVWEQISVLASNALATAAHQGVHMSGHKVCHREISSRSPPISKEEKYDFHATALRNHSM